MAPLIASQAELDRRKIVGINAETVTDVSSTDFPGHWPGEDHAWALDKIKEGFQISFHRNEHYEACFSLIGFEAAIANALRRILIAEIPSLAIEHVFVHNNTSVIQDEVLASRLGLVPLRGSVEGIHWMQWFKKRAEGEPLDDHNSSCDFNTIVMRLDAECTKNEDASPGEQDPRKLYHNAHVYAKDIVYHRVGRQDLFEGPGNEVEAVNPDILLAKLRPGQKIEMEIHAVKGIGADHAKFSPVATATYRLLPDIKITKPILGADAVKFSRCFPPGVITLDTVSAEEASKRGSRYEGHEGEQKAVVSNPFKDTVSRECLRHEEFEGKVKLGRVRDHFIFNIESVGQFESDALFLESVQVLRLKSMRLKRALRKPPPPS